MRLQDIGAAILKRLWVVIAILLVSALAAAVIGQVQKPVYKVEIAISATAPINRTTGLPDAMTQGAYVALTPSISNFAESIQVAELVSRRLANQGIELSPEELVKKVSAMPEANSTSVKITFTDGSPTRVTDIANAWGETMVLMTLKSEANEFFDEGFKNLLLNGNIVFTNKAVVPEKPTQPKPMAYLGLGVFVGLVLGLVLVVLIEYFDPHFRSTREAEESLGLPVLGVLPKVKGAAPEDLLNAFGAGSLTWEAYAELRSGVMLSLREESGSLVVAPAVPFPAAPAVAANLAMSVANTGRKTLLIDGDLRDRALSRLLGKEGRPGLSEVLEKGEDPRGRIVETGISNLFLLPAGARSERSTDLVSSPAFAEELREQEGVFDQVVVYAPALQGSMDAAVLSSAAGGLLVAIDSERCTRKVAEEVMHGLERMGVVPMGVTLANVKVKGRERVPGKGEKPPEPAMVREGRREKKVKPPRATEEAPPAPPAAAKEARRSAAARGTVAAQGALSSREIRPASEAAPTYRKQEPAPAREDALAAGTEREVAGETVGGAAFGGRRETASGAVPEEVPRAVKARRSGKAASAAAPSPGKEGEETKRTAPETAPAAVGEDEAQARERVMEEFRRKGEKGEPIPKTWLRGLTSDKPDVRESATAAITSYYLAFLQRYAIGEDSAREITGTIIRMMRREGEFASIGEAEAQERLRRMLAEAGARLSPPARKDEKDADVTGNVSSMETDARATGTGPATPVAGTEAVGPLASDGKGPERAEAPEEFKLPEKRRFRLASRGEGRSARRGRGKGPKPTTGDEDGIDWE
ncbi:MAG: hypothetical protein HPY75_02000 [Actinobacteria bacterium]|nr:hypothetical protein [Actinomycetota bacterium]